MMKKIVSSVLAAGAAAFILAPSAHAETRPYAQPEAHAVRPVSAYQRNHESEWRDVYRARREFYARWNGNARERARFENWYARRCDELRR